MAIGSGFQATGRRDGPHMGGKVPGFLAIGDMNIKGHILELFNKYNVLQ